MQVMEAGNLRASTTAPTPLVSGLTLAVDTWSVRDNSVELRGAGWGAVIDTVGDLFRFTVTVEVPHPRSATPELVLWLGPFSVMDDRQALTWRRTLVPGPTANGQGLPGNDLPAAYLYDPVRKVETVVAVDAGAMAWAPGRLLGYRCTEKWDTAAGRYGVGLVRTGGPLELPAGTATFCWYLWQGPRRTSPDAWAGAAALVHRLAPLLPDPVLPYQGDAWRQLAAGCLNDLQNRAACWVEPNGIPGLRAYVRDSSRYFGEEKRNFFELMTHMDVLPPLALYANLHPESDGAAIVAELLESLPLFHRPDLHWFVNGFPNRDTLADLWYPFENTLVKLGWAAAVTGRSDLKAMLASALRGATALARKVQYLFPLFAETATGEPVGSAPNYSVAGLYAYGHVQAYRLLGGEEHLAEARTALAVMRRLPLELQYHEPQQLAFAAAAAALLGDSALAEAFLHAQLRQAYWFGDPGAGGADVRGMFQACASLLYPAFKENVEAILPWTVLLQEGVGDARLLLRMIALQRQHNLAYFDDATCPAIPYENLGTSELPQQGEIGKEIYGAGEVFWLYLMTEAFGTADDPAILAVALDLLDPAVMAHLPAGAENFMLYNPTASTRSFQFRGVGYTLDPGEYVKHTP
jgi:hypothetical protein